MLSRQSYLNKDIPLQVIKSNEEDQPKSTTHISSAKSTFFKTVNERNWPEMKQECMNSHINQLSDLCRPDKKNLMKPIEDIEILPQISIPHSQPITFSRKFKQIILNYSKWPLITLFICTFVCLGIYLILNIRKLLPDDNSVYPNSDSEVHITDRDIEDTILKGSTTLLRPVIISHLTKSDFIKEIQFDKVIQNGFSDTQKIDSLGKIMIPQDEKDRSEVISQLGFTSGHQNNFGIPIEEDERILKMLNEKLSLLEKETETLLTNQTESTLKVSPTLPLILHKAQESSTRSGMLEEIRCKSTSLHMCRGVLQYDLTTTADKNVSFTPMDLNSFERLFLSNCSPRAAEFVCSFMEPECRPMQKESLQPCKRFCKSILEACSAMIITSDILTYMFDCDLYPDSNNNDFCEDPTRRSECYENEFKCQDLSCIPRKWLCDNIKDCEDGEDEINCLNCDTNEFRCKSNDMCLHEMYRCDLKEDCSDGSDEQNCDTVFDNGQVSEVQKFVSFHSLLKQNYTNRDIYNNVFDDDRLPAESQFNESVMTTTLAVTTEAKPAQLSTYSINVKSIDQQINDNNQFGTNNTTISRTFQPSCTDDQLRCVSGKCITVNQLCDRVVDCPEGEDEMMCGYDENQPLP